jgi:uncharacterized protein (DUF1330 family)
VTDRPAYLLLLAHPAERWLPDYVAALGPLYQRHGGRHLALAAAHTVEHFGHHEATQSLLLSAWASLQSLLRFWHSRPHRSLLAKGGRQHALCFAAVEGEAESAPRAEDQALAVFLGPGPAPALLETGGARALALARERRVEPLAGSWSFGDIAIYAWPSLQTARRQLVTFSSGQRGRSLLVPVLPATQTVAALPPEPPPLLRAQA